MHGLIEEFPTAREYHLRQTIIASNLADLLHDTGRDEESVDVLGEVHRVARDMHERWPEVSEYEAACADSASRLAWRLISVGRNDEAQPLLDLAEPILHRHVDDHPMALFDYARARWGRAKLLLTRDGMLSFEEFAEAERRTRECLEILAVRMPDTWLHFNAQSLLGGALPGLWNCEEAEPLLLQAFEGVDVHRSEIAPNAQRHITATIDRVIRLCESTNRPRTTSFQQKIASVRQAAAERRCRQHPSAIGERLCAMRSAEGKTGWRNHHGPSQMSATRLTRSRRRWRGWIRSPVPRQQPSPAAQG